METQDYIELLAAQEGYRRMYEKIESAGFGHLIDECVDRENVYPLTEKDGHVYWINLKIAMIDSVGSRMEEVGINPNDYGLPY